MPAIPDGLSSAVVYLFPDDADARKAAPRGGSGFLVAVEHDGIKTVYVGFFTARVNNFGLGSEVVTLPPDSWAWHPDGDDIAVAEIAIEPTPYLDIRDAALSLDYIATSYETIRFGGVPPELGEDVVMLGRLSGHQGHARNEPVARFGNISRLADGEPVVDGRGTLVEAFLVDMRSQSGYSGSPVFVAHQSTMSLQPYKLGLMGIDTGHIWTKVDVYDSGPEEPVPGHYVKVNSGIAVVAPYYKVVEVLNLPELVERRARRSREL